ncbi:MAG: hydroxymethylbilane synthase [Raoultibacter sp.]
MSRFLIGTRKSELALWQAEWVKARLQEHYPSLEVDLVTMDTEGDRELDKPLPLIDGKGVFTAEFERRLYDGGIDIAVHSLKDLPTELPEGLEIGAYCERQDPRDVFLGKEGLTLAELPRKARIGTSSLRRAAQVYRYRPDVECVNIRGNLGTRWRKLQEDESLSGMILAAAGVIRLGWQERITEYLPHEVIMPAVGQGVVVAEFASHRDDVRSIIQAINHVESERAVRAERSYLRALEGGCQVPIGALATCEGDRIFLSGMVSSLDGREVIQVKQGGTLPEEVGKQAARSVLEQGAASILSRISNPN